MLERAWLVAAIAAVGFGGYNLWAKSRFNHYVYFPFICAGFCVLIWRNIRGQRKFLEKREANQKLEQEHLNNN